MIVWKSDMNRKRKGNGHGEYNVKIKCAHDGGCMRKVNERPEAYPHLLLSYFVYSQLYIDLVDLPAFFSHEGLTHVKTYGFCH